MSARNNFINGITELLILSILAEHDSYVYEITKSIQTLSDGLLTLSQNTIYTATYKLEKEHLISEYSKLVGKKRTRVYYHIEDSGLEYLSDISENYQKTMDGVMNVLSALKKDVNN